MIPSQDGAGPGGELRLRILQVRWRQGRLVVRSGLPTALTILAAIPLPAMALVIVVTSGRWGRELVAPLAFGVVTALFYWALLGPWILTLDRQSGWAALRRGPWRTRRPLADLVGVRLWSMQQAQIEKVRRRRQVMPYAPHPDLCWGLALVDRAGRWWRVTRSQDRAYGRPTPRRDEAEQVARRVADHLGLPLLPPCRLPPGGQVPPPFEGPPPTTAA